MCQDFVFLIWDWGHVNLTQLQTHFNSGEWKKKRYKGEKMAVSSSWI